MPDSNPTIQMEAIEAAVGDLMAAFDVPTPPVPVEIMLQRPKPGMWKEVNLSELSTTFINVKQRYSPRMSVARLLARYICASEWGNQRKVAGVCGTDEGIRAFARAILMPKPMLDTLAPSSRTPQIVGMRFEVPEDDARQRLIDLGFLAGA